MTTNKPKQTVKKLKESFNFAKTTLQTSYLELKVAVYIDGKYEDIFMTTTRAGSICFMFKGGAISAANLKKLIG